ncbi:MAG: hypothetical protein H7331_01805 [Bacteroidia bacterium]|nr:hypothetical protein [Bacteroidia bacterium]
MKTIFNKTWLYISIAILILPLNSCEKWRKGVLEIQIIESLLTGGTTTAFLTVTVDEKNNTGYPIEVEFDLKGTNTKKITGFYYPNKSPRALGYTRNQGTPIYLGKNYVRDPEATVFVYKDPAYSGENGHWASSSYSAIKKAEKAASKNSSSSSGSGSSSSVSGSSQYDGIWKRNDGVASYLKLGGTSAKVCSGGSVTDGTFNASVPSATFTVSGQTHVFTFSIRNGLLIMDVPPTSTNPNHVETEYVKTTVWPC